MGGGGCLHPLLVKENTHGHHQGLSETHGPLLSLIAIRKVLLRPVHQGTHCCLAAGTGRKQARQEASRDRDLSYDVFPEGI